MIRFSVEKDKEQGAGCMGENLSPLREQRDFVKSGKKEAIAKNSI
ncbi:hypothetical protein COO91_07872 [Nostoc flagelliforme CCNUN1]|uniref:Uncharacterized protein n=1 Tax=Nostoc flagelliforme CCNUN1 TaxID=2038116 RepID=A0A2K8T2A6_9NOSO|nr:hypothetical protein [Nostoc flagelliforme]AUB41799.1 hypothetical protein COO91_07872 [Nostoc flagelliforme CCNUN1]